MTWIEIVPPDKGGEALARAYAMQRTLYPAMYGEPKPPREDGSQAESIVASHSLIPDALFHAFATFGALMSPDLPLERRQHEMIATMVSVTNRCRYWIASHAEFLRKVTLDDSLVEALRNDWHTAPITDAERVMIEYVVQLTEDATCITPEHHQKLHSVGFDDRGILQITLIASWFNYINRVADALGVGRD